MAVPGGELRRLLVELGYSTDDVASTVRPLIVSRDPAVSPHTGFPRYTTDALLAKLNALALANPAWTDDQLLSEANKYFFRRRQSLIELRFGENETVTAAEITAQLNTITNPVRLRRAINAWAKLREQLEDTGFTTDNQIKSAFGTILDAEV